MIPRTHFCCITTWVARSSGLNSAIHLFRFTSQMALLSNINFYFDCKTRLPHHSCQAREKIFLNKKVLSTRYDDINEQDTSFLDCKHKHVMKSTAPPDKSCSIWLPIEFHGSTSRIISKAYHSLVPGLISIFLRDGMGPFTGLSKACFLPFTALAAFCFTSK